MKRAFEENLPRVKPRVRFTSEGEQGVEAKAATPETPETAIDMEAAVSSAAAAALGQEAASSEPVTGATASVGGEAQVTPSPRREPRARQSFFSPFKREPALPPSLEPEHAKAAQPTAPPTGSLQPETTESRDRRRRKLREKLWALQNPATQLDGASPQAPAAVVAVAEDLARELAEARARADRLEHELSRARADLSRAVTDAEARHQTALVQDSQLTEARQLLSNLEAELSVVEEERDEVLAEVRGLREADGARRSSLTTLSHELDETRRALAEARSEQSEIVRELEAGDAENVRLSLEVKRLESERARLLQELSELASTKGQLNDSRRTLERVHQLLAVAAAPRKR